MRVGFVRIVWLILAALAAFVIFVECFADVGGGHDPILQPTPTRQISE